MNTKAAEEHLERITERVDACAERHPEGSYNTAYLSILQAEIAEIRAEMDGLKAFLKRIANTTDRLDRGDPHDYVGEP